MKKKAKGRRDTCMHWDRSLQPFLASSFLLSFLFFSCLASFHVYAFFFFFLYLPTPLTDLF